MQKNELGIYGGIGMSIINPDKHFIYTDLTILRKYLAFDYANQNHLDPAVFTDEIIFAMYEDNEEFEEAISRAREWWGWVNDSCPPQRLLKA